MPLAFGGPFLSPEGGFGRVYFAVVAIFAIGVSVGIVGLAFRRFAVRPRWLGEKLSYESGVIALLIFVLMVTYLAAYQDLNTAPPARQYGGRMRLPSWCSFR